MALLGGLLRLVFIAVGAFLIYVVLGMVVLYFARDDPNIKTYETIVLVIVSLLALYVAMPVVKNML